MKHLLKRFTALILTLALLFTLVPTVNAATSDETTITILSTTDLHGRIYSYDYAIDSEDKDAGLAKLTTLIKQERAANPNSLLVDCGDTIQDNSAELFNAMDVHPMIQAMNMIGYDTWTIGNHEFNFGLDLLTKNIDAFEGAVLSANIYKEGTEERWLAPYEIFEVDGVKVAVVGMMPPEVPRWEASTPDHFAGLAFTETLAETKKVVAELEGQYDVLVGAYHVGPEGEYTYAGLEAIAEECPEFDVLLGGHAHSKYLEEVNGVTLLEPGKYGWALGKVDITVDKADNNKVVSVTGEQLETYDVEPDQEIIDAFANVHEESVADANQVVGSITADFIESPDYITGESSITTMPTAQLMDTAIIDLINEVQMHFTEADVSAAALFNFGSNLTKGDFKKKDVAYIYKYPNTLVGVNITGEGLLEYMEWSASYYNTYKEGDITISFNEEIRGYNYDMFTGVDYEVDISQEAGNRIKNATINGEPIDPTATYKLALNNYRFGTILKLGVVTLEDKYYDSYEEFQDAGRIRDLIINYTVNEKDGVLEPKVDNNWKVVGYDEEVPYKEEVFEMVRSGQITIPTSADERTKNVKSLNLYELIEEGIIQLGTYSIQSGDVLWQIAEEHGTTWESLTELNNLTDPHFILPGQELLVPAK